MNTKRERGKGWQAMHCRSQILLWSSIGRIVTSHTMCKKKREDCTASRGTALLASKQSITQSSYAYVFCVLPTPCLNAIKCYFSLLSHVRVVFQNASHVRVGRLTALPRSLSLLVLLLNLHGRLDLTRRLQPKLEQLLPKVAWISRHAHAMPQVLDELYSSSESNGDSEGSVERHDILPNQS